MKSNRKKRILAAILCMVMVLTSNISALAEGEGLPDVVGQEQAASETAVPVPEVPTENTAATQPQSPAPTTPETIPTETQGVPSTTPETTPAATPDSTPEVTPAVTPEVSQPAPQEQGTTQTPGAGQEPAAGTTPETTPGTTPAAPETTVTPGAEGAGQQPTPGTTPETTPTVPETTPETTPEAEEKVLSEATELTQEFKDASGQVIQKITAKLPAGAFEAETSQITMEVRTLDRASENHIKNLMEKRLPQGDLLGDYMLYDIRFKVNGQETDSLQPITITFEKSGLEIKDVKKANVFYYDPADPAVAGDQDELIEITQRSEMIENLQASGQGTDKLEEYDLSSIEIKEENRSEKITLEGRNSTIYGCYVEYTPVLTLNFENEEVTVAVSADEAGIIPDDATLKVVPITAEDKATKAQYEEVEKQIQEKVAEEEKEVAGFLAYDISFVDAAGNEMEPNGKVKVSINYKKAELPKEVEEKKATDAEVTVYHLEENAQGDVKQVVDMATEQNATINTLATTEGAKVQSVEVETEGFSVFTITWKYGDGKWDQLSVDVHYGYMEDDRWKEFENEQDLEPSNIPTFTKTGQTIELDKYIKEIQGYTYQTTTKDVPALYEKSIEKLKSSSYSVPLFGSVYEIKANDDTWLSTSIINTKTKGDIYYVYTKDTSSGGNTGGNQEPSLGVPTHNKYIKQNELGEDYTLTLDVTGGIGEPKTLDVLFIIDESNSMSKGSGEHYNQYPWQEKTRADIAEEAIDSFRTVIQESEAMKNGDLKLNYAAVGFGREAYQKKEWTSFPKFGSLGVNVNDNSGGTNWEDGVFEAEKLLQKKASDGNGKVVIFLTDGNPTKSMTSGDGTEYDKDYYDDAVERWNKFSPTLKQSAAYVVDMYKTAEWGEVNKCSDFAEDIKATYIDGTSASALKSGFETIAANIARPAYKNVEIVDTLSDWVELKDGSENTIFTLKQIRRYSEETIAKGTLSKVSKYITYDEQTKQITVDLSKVTEDHILEDGVKYSVEFDVKPSEEAEERYAADGKYPNTGEKKTDVPGYREEQYTSSGKPGFFSNERAYVSYHINDGDEKQADYPKPVVQVKEASAEITITKVDSSGNSLAGAVFELTKENATKSWKETSGTDGKLTFTGLTDGVYILEEVSAPNGYETTAEKWKVTVVTENTETVAKLYKADGETLVQNNTIINYTETEMAEKNLKSSKTAKVVDEDDRIFQIDLNASTSGQGAGQAAKGASIVLALDASSSMGNSGMLDIKDAAEKFVDSAYGTSKLSEIAVVWYNGTEGEDTDKTTVKSFETLANDQVVKDIKDFIDAKTMSGGTPMGDAMKKSYELLKGARNNNKYVIFFTDGKPGHNNSDTNFNCMVANKAYEYAKKIKDTNDGNAVIYTVGRSLSGSFKWQPGHPGNSNSWQEHKNHDTYTTAEAFLSDYIATTGKAFTTTTTEGLLQIFKDIEGEIGDLFTIKPEKIVDVIDARFELTDKSQRELKNAGAKIISNNDGTTTIVWTDDNAIIGNEAASSDGSVRGPWSASFQIKAKDDFIGGNMVPTNGAASGIYLDEESTRYFDQPSVNVKLLSLSMEDKESWYYKGDIIDPAEFMNKLDETLNIHQLDDEVTDTGNPTLPELTEERKAELATYGTLVVNNNGDVENLKYTYPYTSDAVGYFRYTYEIVKDGMGNQLGDMASHKAENVGEDVEQYKLTVEFIPYSVEERDSNLNVAIKTPTENGGTVLNPETDKLTAAGTYFVNVVAGEIQITKKLEEVSDTDQTFSFVITKDGKEFKTVTITIPSGELQSTYLGEGLKNLERGYYEIKESKATGYAVKEIVLTNKVDENGESTEYATDCGSVLDSPKTVTFALGNNKNGFDVIQKGVYKEDGVFGGVLFTNEEVISDWGIVKRSATNQDNFLSDAEFQLSNDKTTYYGKSNQEGLVEWYEQEDFDGNKVEKLSQGTYTLKETKAPVAYALSDEEWTVEITHDGALKSIKNVAGDFVDATVDVDGVYKYYFDNVMAYELPSTGGTGIFVYTIGGTLLLMAAALLIYRMKREEVLKR